MKSALSQLIISLAVCAAVLAAYGAWYATVSGKSGAVAMLQEQIDAKTRAVTKLATTRAALSELATDEATLAGYFVSGTEVVSFIDGLETHGKDVGAAVGVVSVSPEKMADQPALALSLSVTGPFDAVMRTVGTIEYAPYDLALSSLSVSKDAAKGGWRADMKILVGSDASSTPPVPPSL